MYRTIDVSLWSDPKVAELKLEAKALFIYLITNQMTHVSGIYYLPKVFVCKQLRISDTLYDTLSKMLEKTELVYFDPPREIVFVRNFFRHQGKGTKNAIAAASHLYSLHRSPLIDSFLCVYPEVRNFLKYPIDTVSIPHPDWKAEEQEQEQEQNKEKREPDGSPKKKPRVSLLADLWNEIVTNLPKVAAMNPDRRSKEALRLKQKSDLEFWRVVFTKINQSNFCRGLSPTGSSKERPWQATFDWIISNDTNCLKVFEGNYDNRDSTDQGNGKGKAPMSLEERKALAQKIASGQTTS
jgi:hypothetical protein